MNTPPTVSRRTFLGGVLAAGASATQTIPELKQVSGYQIQ
jgi:hypothetical protein